MGKFTFGNTLVVITLLTGEDVDELEAGSFVESTSVFEISQTKFSLRSLC